MPSSAWRTDVCSRSEEHTSELQSLTNLVCRLLLVKKKNFHRQPLDHFPCVRAHHSSRASYPLQTTLLCSRYFQLSLQIFFFFKSAGHQQVSPFSPNRPPLY